ncbi:MAG: hypothetical protein JWN33_431 [Candidatus Saccharibacteria bacterium]|nr:hypothetical protein [Candidatus Saccharibacteria bacterium]
MRPSLKHTALRLQSVVRRNSPNSRNRRRLILKFAEKMGMVYFGRVDQFIDEHRVVRGLTVSSTHKDDSYCVGSYNGYDISLVDRTDIVVDAKQNSVSHNWLILEIDLNTSKDVPHFFLQPHSHEEAAYAKLFLAFAKLQPASLDVFAAQPPEFSRRYGVFVTPTDALRTEKYLNAIITRKIAAHFWPLAVEVYHNTVYIYASNHKHVTMQLLSTMLENGVWLASALDENAQLIEN